MRSFHGADYQNSGKGILYRAFKENKLIRGKYQRIPAFKEFAADFWDIEKSGYLQSIKSRKKISRAYPDMGKAQTVNHLIPEFGDLRLDAITDKMIDTWLLSFPKKGYSIATANNFFKFLREEEKGAS